MPSLTEYLNGLFTGQPAPAPQNTLAPPIWPASNPVGTERFGGPEMRAAQSGFQPAAEWGGRPVSQAFKDKVDQATTMALGFTGGTTPIKAYHGSPHSFERFDASKIGTGEGAQTYGHGLYFAEHEPTAQYYRDQVIPPSRSGLSRDAENWLRQARQEEPTAGLEDIKQWAAAMHDPDNPGTAANAIADEIMALKPGSLGHMYEAQINANPDHFLQWDKPLSEQHPKVQKVMADRFDLRPGGVKEREAYLASLPNDELRAVATKALDNPNILGDSPEFARLMKEAPDIDHNAVWDIQRAALHPEGWGSYSRQPTTLGDIYKDYLGNPVETASALREAGIPGIRYLDQGSRTAGEGTHNYVVFDDATVAILRKYGLTGLIGGGAATAGTQSND